MPPSLWRVSAIMTALRRKNWSEAVTTFLLRPGPPRPRRQQGDIQTENDKKCNFYPLIKTFLTSIFQLFLGSKLKRNHPPQDSLFKLQFLCFFFRESKYYIICVDYILLKGIKAVERVVVELNFEIVETTDCWRRFANL